MENNREERLVSILMTAYNREKFIADAIESVLNSSWKNFELIILDDKSTDQTVSIARHYEHKDNRIKLYVNEKNLGQFANRNKVIEYANSEYLITVDSDDMIYTDTVSYLMNSMFQYPNASFGMYNPSIEQNTCLDSEQSIRNHFFKQPFLTHGPGGTILKKSFFGKIGGYPTEYGVPGDMYFNLKAATNTPVVLLSKEFMFYRRHEGQEINNSYDYLYNNYRYLKDALQNISLPLSNVEKEWIAKKNKRRFLVNIIRFFLKTKNIKKTRNAIRIAGFGFNDVFVAVFH